MTTATLSPQKRHDGLEMMRYAWMYRRVVSFCGKRNWQFANVLLHDADICKGLVAAMSGNKLDLVAISRDPTHPMYAKIKFAHDYANGRRAEAGFSIDPWPLTPYTDIHNRKWLRLIWLSDDALETKDAHALYERFVGEGYAAWSVTGTGEADAPVDAFDPTYEELLFRVLKDDET